MEILTLNAGSSSLKAALFSCASDKLTRIHSASLSGLGTEAPKLKLSSPAGDSVEVLDGSQDADHLLSLALKKIVSQLSNPDELVISHRVVHGGDQFKTAQKVTAKLRSDLETLIPLAPLHQPHNLHLIDLVNSELPETTSIACFDTMFHALQPIEETTFALPKSLRDQHIRRYGFHGLSYEYIAQTLELEQKPSLKSVVLHLGAGSSACAMRGAHSVATSMGFSAVDGLPMGTRTGQLDPGVLLHLMDLGWSKKQIEKLLYKESGWLGLSGISSDMKTLLDSDDPRAQFAVDHYCYHIALEVGRLAAALQGIDQLVFTGGVGANAAAIREQVVERCAWLRIDTVTALETDEELMLAQHALELCG